MEWRYVRLFGRSWKKTTYRWLVLGVRVSKICQILYDDFQWTLEFDTGFGDINYYKGYGCTGKI